MLTPVELPDWTHFKFQKGLIAGVEYWRGRWSFAPAIRRCRCADAPTTSPQPQNSSRSKRQMDTATKTPTQMMVAMMGVTVGNG